MPLTSHQIDSLIAMVATVEPDEISCDECYGRVAEYAEWQLSKRELPEAFQAIESHLRQCPCCRDEYRALLEALEEIAAEKC